MKIDTDKYPVTELIRDIKQRELALPEFQRDFVWKPRQIADLFRTIARKWPAGSLLLMRMPDGEAPFELKAMDRAPRIDAEAVPEVDLIVLDGQQRLTSLYQVLTDNAEEVYYIDVLKVIRDEGFDDDHLMYKKKTTFSKKYSNYGAMAADGIAPIHVIWDDERFDEWKSHLPRETQLEVLRARKELFPGLRGYELPGVVLPKDVDFAAVTKIFETLNRTGTKLDAFDLMVARLFPLDFRLKDQWEAAMDQATHLKGYQADGMDPLRLLALREHLRQESQGRGDSHPVKGVRQSDVLAVERRRIVANWNDSVSAFDRALGFVKSKMGATHEFLIPSWTMLLPIADALYSQASREGWEEDLERWVWATAFSNSYAQGANTQAVTDAKALRAWLHDPSAVPLVVRDFKFDPECLDDERRRNENVLRALLCVSIMEGARDWISDKPIRDVEGPLELHHVFPKRYLESISATGENSILNFAVILASSNASFRNDPPGEVLKRSEVADNAVRTHSMPLDDMRKNDWPGFLVARRKAAEELVRAFLSKRSLT